MLLAAPLAAQAQQYPNQDIHFICAFPAGSGSDLIVRYVAERVKPLTGRNIIVENRFGASGNVAAEYTMRSKPDGYTIFVHAASAVAANMHMFKKPPIDAAKDVQVAATINRQPFMMAVDAKRPWKTVADVTAYLKEKGDKATYATSATNGTVMGEIYKQATGTKAVEVVFRVGMESLNDLLSGAIDYGMYDPVFSMSQAREGRAAHAGGLDRAACAGSARPADHDRTRHSDGPDRAGFPRWCRRRRRVRSSIRSTPGSGRSSRPTKPRRSSTGSAAIRGSHRRTRRRRGC